MNLQPWWASLRYSLVFVMATAGIGHPAVTSAGAHERPTLERLDQPVKVNGITCHYKLVGPLPSSSTKGEKFSPWKVMHPHTFDTQPGSFVRQCEATIGSLSWLTSAACQEFGEALAQGYCAVVSKVNSIDLDTVRGKEQGKSKAFLYERMELAESRQAVFVPLSDDRWLGMFTGEPGKSCNNFFALRDVPAKPAFVPPPITTPPVPQGKWVCRNVAIGDVVRSDVYQQQEALVIKDCCNCGNGQFVPSFKFALGDTMQSSGYAEVCNWEPN